MLLIRLIEHLTDAPCLAFYGYPARRGVSLSIPNDPLVHRLTSPAHHSKPSRQPAKRSSPSPAHQPRSLPPRFYANPNARSLMKYFLYHFVIVGARNFCRSSQRRQGGYLVSYRRALLIGACWCYNGALLAPCHIAARTIAHPPRLVIKQGGLSPLPLRYRERAWKACARRHVVNTSLIREMDRR